MTLTWSLWPTLCSVVPSPGGWSTFGILGISWMWGRSSLRVTWSVCASTRTWIHHVPVVDPVSVGSASICLRVIRLRCSWLSLTFRWICSRTAWPFVCRLKSNRTNLWIRDTMNIFFSAVLDLFCFYLAKYLKIKFICFQNMILNCIFSINMYIVIFVFCYLWTVLKAFVLLLLLFYTVVSIAIHFSFTFFSFYMT